MFIHRTTIGLFTLLFFVPTIASARPPIDGGNVQSSPRTYVGERLSTRAAKASVLVRQLDLINKHHAFFHELGIETKLSEKERAKFAELLN